jgi:SpoVK/Ycf46/Vps4 family AAA+-type ATPase
MFFTGKKKVPPKYKFSSLRTYCSTEWMLDSTKRYRTVFDTSELTFVYVELCLFNKSSESWKLNLRLCCHKLIEQGRETICQIEISPLIQPEQDLIYIREGWGHEDTETVWKRGDYIWEAFVDNQLLGTCAFHVEEAGVYSLEQNSYLEINSVAFFEGNDLREKNTDYHYLTKFSVYDTRYVWVEVKATNLQNRTWFCEFKFIFFNSSFHIKAITTEIKEIKPHSETFSIYTGWGAPEVGTWPEDSYMVCVLFMDKPVALSRFEVGDYAVEGLYNFMSPADFSKKSLPQEVLFYHKPHESIEELHLQIRALVGLEDVKKKIQEYIHYIDFLRLRREFAFSEDLSPNLHTVLMGSPGTGKTTVARILAKIYHKMGLLSTGILTEVGRNELVGQFIGQTAPKVIEVIEKARGGVLFIDEAYSLARAEGDDKDYGNEAIEVIVKEMSDGKGDLAIFVAGYHKEMEVFLNSNPGLKSRFKMFFNFQDFLPQELFELLDLYAQKHQVVFEAAALQAMHTHLTELYRRRDKSFGNARTVNSLVEDAKMFLGVRVMTCIEEQDRRQASVLQTITLEDVEKVFEKRKAPIARIAVDQKALDQAMSSLESLVGLSSIKREIREWVELVRYYRQSGQEVTGKFSLHTVFKGNPGTGKTTVARIMANIFKALGLLERGHLVECDRQSLVAGFVGHTAIKTKEVVDKAKGGVLFIDEAYSLLHEGKNEDYGKEAIEVILKEMEDHRGQFMVIVAGYTEEMKRFLRMNPGLKSRFDREIYFEDFSIDELVQISLDMFKQAGFTIEEKAVETLRKTLSNLYQSRDKYFGNARSARKIVDMAIRQQNLRMAVSDLKELDFEQTRIVLTQDIEGIDLSGEEMSMSPNVGFKLNY